MGITETSQMATADGMDNGSKLTLQLFADIFKCLEPEVQIDTFEEEQGSGRGDNYTATLYRIHLTGQRKCPLDGKKQKWENNVICKRLPENIKLREAYKSDKLFRNEVEFYTAIMPELLKFQSTKSKELFKALPKCYYARSDLLIMEDLRIRGFQMPDRKQGLTIDETRTVLRQVAQFHALSLAYKFENPKQFENLRKLNAEALFSNDNANWYKKYYETLTKNAIKMISDVLPEDSKYLQIFKQFAEVTTFFQRMVNMVSEESALSAFCHGDCWTNNFLYRYEPSLGCERKVLEVCLVDFQMIRYSSITLDVANLLFCCTSKSMRDSHLAEFLKMYTSDLYLWLQSLCSQIPDFCNSYEKFENLFHLELKKYGSFALGLSLDIIPISTCSSEDAPDMYINRADAMDSPYGAPELNFPPNDLCRQKMSEILIDMVDMGML
ncbi:uncharacterized protein LOC106096356 [Stomoxys calcitrans]|uniref:CHK kinase-like domain-containing protein n=1 Tax=Stomoxys calcitrans TaxID=35570 RepID=A0A1I8NNZ5_STOCA|nr:uncharacterized protein LOC106096356 [Stomoxys calcitrans]